MSEPAAKIEPASDSPAPPALQYVRSGYRPPGLRDLFWRHLRRSWHGYALAFPMVFVLAMIASTDSDAIGTAERNLLFTALCGAFAFSVVLIFRREWRSVAVVWAIIYGVLLLPATIAAIPAFLQRLQWWLG